MIGMIVTFFLIIIIVAIFAGVTCVFACMVASIIFFIRFATYHQISIKKPSTMVCPNCQSNRIKITSRIDGLSSSSTQSILLRTSKRQITRSHIAACQDCGYDYEYITKSDVEEAKVQAKKSLKLGISCAIISIVVAVALALVD